jgi:MFS family permease
MILEVVSSILGASSHYINSGLGFGLLYGLARFIQGFGSISILTANFSIMMKTFPKDIPQAAGYIEALSGLGLILGPVIGSALYAVGDFATPFYFCGLMFLIPSFFVFKLIPSSVES